MAAALTLSSAGINLIRPENNKAILSLSRCSLQLHQRYSHSSGVIRHAQSDASFSREYETAEESDFDGYEVVQEDEESDEDGDETESSVDLLIRFLQSLFKKVSKRAKKASRTVLPSALSHRLVSFAVDGILLLASLSIAKAFLEVICTLGGTVFTAILLVRVVWAIVAYFQPSGTSFNQSRSCFGASQPMA